MEKDDIQKWITTENGTHIPIRQGQTKTEAVNAFFNQDDDYKYPQYLARMNGHEGRTKEPAVVKVNLDDEFQKQFNKAETPKERQRLAFRYIMENLRGEYSAPDGRTVAIERVGAKKMTYQDNRNKLRVCPALADMINAGEYDHSAKGEDKQNKKFDEFAYYKIRVKMGDEVYIGMLNVGIRKDGSSTLYDLRPFYKDEK